LGRLLNACARAILTSGFLILPLLSGISRAQPLRGFFMYFWVFVVFLSPNENAPLLASYIYLADIRI